MYNAGCGFNLNNSEAYSNFQLSDVHPNQKAHNVLGSRLTGFIASH
jgi:lysophospholipase L1-like esterase